MHKQECQWDGQVVRPLRVKAMPQCKIILYHINARNVQPTNYITRMRLRQEHEQGIRKNTILKVEDIPIYGRG